MANGTLNGSIGAGLLVLVGLEDADSAEDVHWMSNKLVQLRLFNDAEGIPNISVKDAGGDLMVISQFTLHAATKKGNRPSYIRAARPEVALPLYHMLLQQLEADLGKPIAAGIFGADMQVSLVNDGPITIIIDSKQKDF